MKPCKDCGSTTRKMTDKNGRPLPGPRCVTCHREALKARKASSHERRVQEVYGLAPGDYDRLYEAQGGTCAICRRARGIARKLAVDHDHRSGRVRGLLCSTCNKILGHLRDDSSVAYGIYSYLTYYPAQKLGIVAYHQDNRKEGPDG